MMRMYNPAHPGAVLREYMGEMSVSALAAHLKVNRVTLSRLLNGTAGVSAEMSVKLSEAFATSEDFWLNMQVQYDLWRVTRKRRKAIPSLVAA